MKPSVRALIKCRVLRDLDCALTYRNLERVAILLGRQLWLDEYGSAAA